MANKNIRNTPQAPRKIPMPTVKPPATVPTAPTKNK